MDQLVLIKRSSVSIYRQNKFDTFRIGHAINTYAIRKNDVMKRKRDKCLEKNE